MGEPEYVEELRKVLANDEEFEDALQKHPLHLSEKAARLAAQALRNHFAVVLGGSP